MFKRTKSTSEACESVIPAFSCINIFCVVEHENDEFQEHKASDLKTKEKKNLII